MPTSPETRSAARFREATRVLTGVLAPIEKRTLVWLAARMPAPVNSDHLTALALAAMILAGGAYWLASVSPIGLLLVIVCLAINWFGDSLDGTLARVRGQQRPRYGFYVDHVVDMFGMLFLVGGMALSGFMQPWVALVLLVAYFMLSAEIYLATYSLATFRMSFFSIGPTELRIILAIGNLVLFVHPTAGVAALGLSLFDAGGLVAAAGLFVTLVVSAATNTRALYRLEPRPAPGATLAAPAAPVSQVTS
jgi:archaetidylinositol phosphate synthase